MTLFAMFRLLHITCSCRGLTHESFAPACRLTYKNQNCRKSCTPAYMMLTPFWLISYPDSMHVSLQAVDKLSRQWKLLYTINSELTGLLGLGRLPGVEVGEISQSVNGSMLSITNTVTVGGAVSRTAFSAKAAFEIMSPKRIQVCALLALHLSAASWFASTNSSCLGYLASESSLSWSSIVCC